MYVNSTMKKNVKIKDIYLINLVKFKSNGHIKPINLEKEYKSRDKFLRHQLTYLASKSSYMQELERLSKLKKEKLIKQNIKVQINKKMNKELLNKKYRIMKGSCNKMILDLIYNNPKVKKMLISNNKHNFSNDNKNDNYKPKIKIENSTSIPLFKYKYEKCHTDSINIFSDIKSPKKFKHSLSFLTPNSSRNLFPKKKISIIKSLNKVEKNNFFSSNNILEASKYRETDDEIKGMLSINYNILKNKKNNNINKRYSYYKYKNNIKL